MNRTLSLLLLAATVLTGCASHHKLLEPRASLAGAGVVRDAKQAARLKQSLTDAEIAGLLDLDVRANLPTNLAVAKLVGGDNPHLERIDAEELAAWEKVIAPESDKPDPGGITGIAPVSNPTCGNYLGHPRITLRGLRMAAARLHCELLLVYLQADSRVDNYNSASVLYWTLAGLWVVPGNSLEHKTVMQGVVVDCRTGIILGAVTGDSHLTASTPAAFKDIERKKLATQAPDEALAEMQKACRPLLAEVVRAARKRATR